jgi:transposase-like protein
MNCPKCKQTKYVVKNGKLQGEQRFCCKNCKFNFTKLTDLNKPHPDSKPPEVRKLANTLYLKGNSFRDIKAILEDTFENLTVNANSIIKWIKKGGLESKKKK